MQHQPETASSRISRSENSSDPPRPSVDRDALPPGPPELPVIGQGLRLQRDLIGLLREAATYGDVSTVSVNPILICLVNHPELNREVLVTNHQKARRGWTVYEVFRWLLGDSLTTTDGAYHLKQRRLMQPQFHRRRIESYAEVMMRFATDIGRSWSDGATLDMEQEMRELTLRIIVKALFGVDLPDTVRRIGEAFGVGNNYMYVRLAQPPFLRRLFHKLPLPLSRRFKRSREYIDETVYSMIRERRLSAGDDLLSMLLEARYEDATGEEDSRMSDEQVRDEVVSLYIAGFDTTATTLTWCFYRLSEHPEVEAKFHAEIDDVLGGVDQSHWTTCPT